MSYLVSFSETDLDLVMEALELATHLPPRDPFGLRQIAWLPGQSEPSFERIRAELGELKARQDAA